MKSFLKFIQTRRALRKRLHQGATIFSLVVVLLLFGLFLEAYMHNFNLVYITLFFVFALAFTASSMSMENIGFLKAEFLHKTRLFEKEEALVPITIVNPMALSSWGVNIRNKAKTISLSIGEIKANSHKLISFPITPPKRGAFVYDDLTFDSKFPLSTAHLSMHNETTLESTVYPQPYGKSLSEFLEESEAYYGEEKEFDGLISYDGSQKLSHIHWASVAKGEMSVKKFIKETQTPELVFDFTKAGNDDEKRLSQLCLWVLACEKQHLPFSIEMPQKKLTSQKESIDEILSFLGTY